jgi:hypothetical protein
MSRVQLREGDMFSVRILATSAALLLVTGLAQTPAYACGNIFFPCPQPTSPTYPRATPAPTYPFSTSQPVQWGMPAGPGQPVVAAPYRTVVAKPSKRRTAKYRARKRTTVKATATVTRPAAAATKPATAAAKPATMVATKPDAGETTTPVAAVPKPAAEPPVAAARSIIFAAASLDEIVRSVKREPDKEEPKEPAAKLVAVVDPGEVNEIDLTASPARTVLPAAAAVVEEIRSRASPTANASVGQVLAIVLGAVAAACVFRFVAKSA